MAAAMTLGLAPDYAGFNAMKLLFWPAVIKHMSNIEQTSANSIHIIALRYHRSEGGGSLARKGTTPSIKTHEFLPWTRLDAYRISCQCFSFTQP